MRSRASKNLLITTALALVLTTGNVLAGSDDPAPKDPIAAAIPIPEPANVPPLTASDVGGPVTGTAPSDSTAPVTTVGATQTNPSIDDLVPMPETADVPPPTAKDIVQDTKPAPAPTTTEAKPTPAPAAAPSGTATADQAVVDKLSELLTGKFDRFTERKQDRTAILAFYKERAFAPLWIENGAPTARANAVVAKLKESDADGLDPDDFATPRLSGLDTPQALAEAELKLTIAAMHYARVASSGRVHPWRMSADVDYVLPTPEPSDVLAKLGNSKDITKTLDAFNPPQPGFQALRKKLAELRGRGNDAPTVRVPPGPTVKVGKKDPRVPVLRERLGLEGDATNTAYDKNLAEAVMAFQRSNGLSATGTLNPATVDALNGSRTGRGIDTIIANMERWRWLPRELGKTYVMVNIPDFTLRVVHNGSLVWHTKIVVGKPHKQTPLLTAEMKYITVNPTWNVPPSIVQNEYIPALRNDPDAMSRIGLKVSYNPDGTIHISQPPGERNALGRVRFNFPNKFLVYQHDTPDKHLFAKDVRAFSHGCMRVQDPVKYAEVLLGLVLPKEGYTQERIRHMFGSAEVDIKFPTFLPVHLTYQTAYVNDDGKLVIRDDIYGFDAKLASVLRGDHRVAETSPGEPRRESYKPARMARPGGDPRQAAQGPLWFFGRLFQ
jgi:murein L,D-transpeptidase YcbB/YkuD